MVRVVDGDRVRRGPSPPPFFVTAHSKGVSKRKRVTVHSKDLSLTSSGVSRGMEVVLSVFERTLAAKLDCCVANCPLTTGPVHPDTPNSAFTFCTTTSVTSGEVNSSAASTGGWMSCKRVKHLRPSTSLDIGIYRDNVVTRRVNSLHRRALILLGSRDIPTMAMRF